ncbi:MAG: alpha/beta hydrolase [Clostridia bacterium]|nr:alpha/beta hydrolase [Clostridia bacterium]
MIWFEILVLIALLLFLVGLLTAYIFLRVAARRLNPQRYIGASVLGPSPRAKYREEIAASTDFARSLPSERLTISAEDGISLSARLILPENPKRCVLLFHGFRSSPERDFNIMIPFLYENDCALLLVDARAHGQSGGIYMTYGVMEGRDCVLWTKELQKRLPALPLFIYGTSMGASAVMFAADKELSPTVKGAIADCGFTSPHAILAFSWKRKMKSSPVTIMPFISVLIRLVCGYNPKVCVKDSLKNASIPYLFIHGTEDKTVPYRMSVENSAACRSAHKLLLIEGGEHCTNCFAARNEYCAKILRFFSEAESQ